MDFFGKFGKTIVGVGENIGLNTEISKLNNDIELEQEKINQLYYFIGKSYYEKHKNDPNLSEESDRIIQINNLLNKIEKDKNAINKLKDVIVCENCGSEIPANSSFCIKCGAKIEKEELLCPNCKKPIEKNDIFCGNCGTKLVDTEKSTDVTNENDTI
ncbi:zinc ribbon domain-containing protein [Anaerococcus sp. AGMB09787]|uniref:zinc ribbon domain-containing protein n=1 Tax=Anaerococcus sp. AGMB09787 TaxID=2922869 RepID=UPI001FAFAD4F|nr:zinc ribbon domain-containing protein [Anaerococcus sp. AGMB09787]